MTQKEINKLEERVCAISSSAFPLDTFFNDIQNNQAPNYNWEQAYKDLKLIVDEVYRLRELEKTPTLEEIQKEWENLGYEFITYTAEEYTMKKFEISKYGEKIILWFDHSYSKVGKTDHCFTIQEHLLLTKMFRALRWFNE